MSLWSPILSIFPEAAQAFRQLGRLQEDFPTQMVVWGSGSDDVFSVGDSRSILHYVGASWSLRWVIAALSSTITENPGAGWIAGLEGFYIPWRLLRLIPRQSKIHREV